MSDALADKFGAAESAAHRARVKLLGDAVMALHWRFQMKCQTKWSGRSERLPKAQRSAAP